MHDAPHRQLSLTDPDARSMKCRGTGIVGYNVQTAVDTKHHLIVAHEVTNAGIDRRQPAKIAKQAKEAMAPGPGHALEAVADQGYYRGEEILACDEAGIIACVAKTDTSGKRTEGEFGRNEFRYIAKDNEYECPVGERLVYRFTREEAGKKIRRYWASTCVRCPIKSKCTPSDYRRSVDGNTKPWSKRLRRVSTSTPT